jgi:hypothetical protein
MSDAVEPVPPPLRPRDFAVLLLSSGDAAPRQRARDQQADRAGLELKRFILNALAARDPEPADMEASLLAIIEDLGPPAGPTRAIAVALLEDWQAASATPTLVAHLLDEAVRDPETKGRRRGR